MQKQKKWKYLSAEAKNNNAFSLVKQITQSDLLAQLLISRGIDTEKKVKEYLNPLEMEFSSPYDFTDMEIAVNRILKAVENNEFILIHGDFDADGITATALLSKLMTLLKANYDIYIPNRETESHGLSTKAIIQKKVKNKLKLVISCDCAVSNVKEVQTIKSLGIETIITDHHEPAETLPDAIAIIDPKVEGKLNSNLDVEKISHLSNLAGVGVAFKLACAILDKIGQQAFVDELLPLVAVGTIADLVPLLGENRALVKMGLNAIENGKNKGLTKLLEISGVNLKNGLKAENIAFQIAPRLNATGRLDKADEGYQLLVSDNGSEIEFLCCELNNKNILRQTLCDKIYQEAVEMYEASSDKEEYAIVLYNEDWHLGVIGIVASKLIEKYNKPVLMMCKDPNSNIIRSSVRSVPGINIFELLSEMKEFFVSFGGHKGAAGLSFDPTQYSLAQVKQKIFELAKAYSQNLDLTPVLKIDLKVTAKDLSEELINKLSLLEPCGMDNYYPVFAIENLNLQEQKLIGQKQNHLKFVCKSEAGTLDCVYWNQQPLEIAPESTIDIAFYPKLNTFNNVTNIQLDIQDAHYECIQKSFNIYDHRKKQNILPQVCDFVNKNSEKVFIYLSNTSYKNELLKMGFPENSFVPKENISHLMFFEYPDCEKSLKKIVENYNPQNLHFMNFNSQMLSLNDFIGKILGMVKYATHNKNGEFDVELVAKTLNTDKSLIDFVIQLLNSVSALQISNSDGNVYHLNYLNPVSFEEIKNTVLYEELNEKWSEILNFKEHLLSVDEKELIEILN